jgi:hypothetical protein
MRIPWRMPRNDIVSFARYGKNEDVDGVPKDKTPAGSRSVMLGINRR